MSEDRGAADAGDRTIAVTAPVRVILTLTGRSSLRQGRAFAAFPIRLGRADDNDLVLDDDPPGQLAEHHAELRREGAAVQLRDLGSPRGTFVNDEPVEAALLRSGDVVRLGAAGPCLKVLLLGADAGLAVGATAPPAHDSAPRPIVTAAPPARDSAPRTIVTAAAPPPAEDATPTFISPAPFADTAPRAVPPTLVVPPGAAPAPRSYARIVALGGLLPGPPPPAELQRDAQDLAELFRGLLESVIADSPLGRRAAALDATLARGRGLAPPQVPGLVASALTGADVTYALPELLAHELRVESTARGFLSVSGVALERLVPDWRQRLPGVPDQVMAASACALRLLDSQRAARGAVTALQPRFAQLRARSGVPAGAADAAALLDSLQALRDALAGAADAARAAAAPILQQAAADYVAHAAALGAALAPAGVDPAALQAAIRADYRCTDPALAATLAGVLATLRTRGLPADAEQNLRAITGVA